MGLALAGAVEHGMASGKSPSGRDWSQKWPKEYGQRLLFGNACNDGVDKAVHVAGAQ